MRSLPVRPRSGSPLAAHRDACAPDAPRAHAVGTGPSGPRRTARQRIGDAGEQQALDYLSAQGLRVLDRNFRVKAGEIDLVLADGPTRVFVEVRQRSSRDFGGAAASVTRAKQLRVRRAAQAWLLARFGQSRWPPVRFDVVAIDAGSIEWIAAAF